MAVGESHPGRGRPASAPRRAARTYRPPAADPARRAAYDVLRAVDARDAYANLVLPGLLRERRLDSRDAAFTTELAYGSLRAQGQLDAVLTRCSARELDAIDRPVLDVLRLGAYQLLHTRVPPHAAVGATVELARSVLSAGPVGFVNAVLRKVADADLIEWVTRVAPPYADDPIGHLAVAHAHPEWVVAAYRDALGGDLDETARSLAADNTRPPVHLVARPGRLTRAELLAAVGSRGSPGQLSTYAVVLTGGDPGALPEVRAGRAGVQDEGSQLVASALAAAPLVGPDLLWADLCAGPGGKSALLAGLGHERGAALLAAEIAPHRAKLVRQTLAGMPGSQQVVTADSRVPPWRPGSFDRVLLDAPCTGLGALRRRPEARWRRQPADLPALTALQRELLGAAFDAVRPGGIVAYVVCSPHLAETRVAVADVTRRRPGVTLLDARPLMPGVDHLGEGPSVQLWPHRHGTDAMHLTLLRRNS